MKTNNSDKVILSLFDHSGVWSAPYARAGYTVIQCDLKHGTDVRTFPWFDPGKKKVQGILLAPPCTAFAGSGAQYWGDKDADGTTTQALALVDAGLRAVAIYQPVWWCLENPVGRLKNWLGPCAYQFDPHNFAGYLVNHPCWPDMLRLKQRMAADHVYELTAGDVRLVKDCNVYTKRTQLWGRFNPLRENDVEPVKVSSQGSWLQLLGGKSERTKELRSMTPAGFAQAFFQANP